MIRNQKSLGLGCVLAFAFSLTGCGAAYEDEGETIGEVTQGTQCGPSQDFQGVEQYNGTLGVSRDFVDDHQAPVGMLTQGCTVTMISNNMFITAGHCSVAVGNTVRFNFQSDPFGNPRPTTDFTVGAIVENQLGGLDYTIGRLNPHPTLGDAGVAFGWTRVAKADPVAPDTLAIIQHPAVMPKMIEAGTSFSFAGSTIRYGDIDTLGGSSGSGILSAKSDTLVGVHTNGGCTTSGGQNFGQRISSLLAASPQLTSLATQLSKNTGGWVWTQQTTGTFPADDSYSWNGANQANTITRLSAGRYRVDMPQQGGETGGNVQVTAYGFGNERCKVESWTSAGTTRQAFVRCFTPAGTSVDTQFTASFVGRFGVTGVDGGYVWANSPTATDYTPSMFFQYNTTGRGITIHRNGTGNYSVRLRGQSFLGGTTEVTAYGAGTEYCKVGSWNPDAVDQFVNVLCFNTSGAPVDTLFSMAFGRNSLHNTPSFTYAWANDPNPASGTYTPDSTYQRGFIAGDGPAGGGRPTNAPVTITHTGTGSYAVNLPEMSDAGGFFGKSNVKVTGYGGDANTCKVVNWFGTGSGVQANVACFTPSGVATDARFTITYSTTQFIIG